MRWCNWAMRSTTAAQPAYSFLLTARVGVQLWTRGGAGVQVAAAQLCYLLAGRGLDAFTGRESRVVLVGADHRRHPRTLSPEPCLPQLWAPAVDVRVVGGCAGSFITPEAFQRTELYRPLCSRRRRTSSFFLSIALMP